MESLTLFTGTRMAVSGDRNAVAERLRELAAQADAGQLLVFDDLTGRQVDLDLREGGDAASAGDDPTQPEHRGPGRPRLGVVGREVTLLPRHWEWLNAQPGGASVALRKLVDQARKDSAGSDRIRQSQEAAFRFMTAMAGNEPGFEDACRALYARDGQSFESRVANWPEDVAAYARQLAEGAFDAEADE